MDIYESVHIHNTVRGAHARIRWLPVFIPDQRALRLVEIQKSVLPEDEWIIGISDLSYFKGVGFSMPLAFDLIVGETQSDEDIIYGPKGCEIETNGITSELITFVEPSIILDDPMMNHGELQDDISITSTALYAEDSIEITSDESIDLIESLERDTEAPNLYAFIPGLFYCSGPRTTVDGFLVEVTQKTLMGSHLSSFKPEDIQSHDVTHARVFDSEGQIRRAEMSLDTLGKFGIEATSKISKDKQIELERAAIKDPQAGVFEMDIALRLAYTIHLETLKEAYVAGSSFSGRFIKLLQSIADEGLMPRHQLFLKNRKHPEGKVINVRYGKYDRILRLGSEQRFDCPDEMDLTVELRKLSFSKLIGRGTEVDVETAIIDMHQFIYEQLGPDPDDRKIVQLLFSEVGE
jgi:hypothetical protein